MSNLAGSPLRLRIHGDNIVECERGVELLARIFSATITKLVSPPYMPKIRLLGDTKHIEVELLAGHGRWGTNVQEVLQEAGAPVREAPDIVLTKLNGTMEEILLAIEFSSALPAGNNAWQRNGRALSCAVAGIPYFYYAEVGGVELDSNRKIKAPRFPNPLVPFSYLTATQAYQVLCLPVYSHSLSSSAELYREFSQTIGIQEADKVIKEIVEGSLQPSSYAALAEKALNMVRLLADKRRTADTLRGNEWNSLLAQATGKQKALWLTTNYRPWSRTAGEKVSITDTFADLLSAANQMQAGSVGAATIPMCLISGNDCQDLANEIEQIYEGNVDYDFLDWLREREFLVIVWVTGFKPRGDDSRPDRGLVPLARMLVGDDVDILTIVSGPGKPAMWSLLEEDYTALARQNGLWESIINLSNAVLADSVTLPHLPPLTLLLNPAHKRSNARIQIPASRPIITFSEHDVDTVIHSLFTTDYDRQIFEAMCNPPGGDWSGISLFDFVTGEEYRWTSLPRVSEIGGKRPDHVVLFRHADETHTLLAIESKDAGSNLETQVGKHLIAYVETLAAVPPIATRQRGQEWQLRGARQVPFIEATTIAGGAFNWRNELELRLHLKRCLLDIVLAVEFLPQSGSAVLHILADSKAEFLLDEITSLAESFGSRLEVQIH